MLSGTMECFSERSKNNVGARAGSLALMQAERRALKEITVRGEPREGRSSKRERASSSMRPVP